jgi:L-ascorbate peroxidase
MAGGSSWTENWLTFDNSYFKRNPNMEMGSNRTIGTDITINEGDENSKSKYESNSPRANQDELLWLPTDEALRKSPEFRSYFHQYAIDQDLFFNDYALAHKKMSELGAKFSFVFELN